MTYKILCVYLPTPFRLNTNSRRGVHFGIGVLLRLPTSPKLAL